MNTTTELIFILDQSSSMQGLVQETLEGYNSLLASQQQLDSPCRLTTVCLPTSPVSCMTASISCRQNP